MQEITDKLAWELVEKLNHLESFCDEKAKEKRTKYDVDTDWMTAACMCHALRTHLYHHMADMIRHPDYTPNNRISRPCKVDPCTE